MYGACASSWRIMLEIGKLLNYDFHYAQIMAMVLLHYPGMDLMPFVHIHEIS